MVRNHLAAYSLFALIAVTGLYSTISANPTHNQNGTAVIAAKDPETKKYKVSMVLPENLSAKQAELLSYAYTVAKNDGHKDPAILQGLILKESSAGGATNYRVAGDNNDRYFGVGQIKVAAAMDVLSRFPQMWEGFQTKTREEVMARLMLDDYFNIKVASKYLLMMSGFGEKSVDYSLQAYNRGPGGAAKGEPQGKVYAKQVISLSEWAKGLKLTKVEMKSDTKVN